MEARNKLQEADYFLGMLRRTPQDRDAFMYNLSAFLNAWRSVLDVMLYDYAEKYCLGLTREDRVSDHEFEIAAKALNNAEALRFIKWWRQQRGRLIQNPLWKKRTVVVHRGYPPTIHVYRLYISESIALSSTFTVSGAPTESAIPTAYAAPTIAAPPSTRREVETRFSDLPDRSIIDICEQAFNDTRAIIEAAEEDFGT